MFEIFAVSTPGLEHVTAAELAELGLISGLSEGEQPQAGTGVAEPGGVTFWGGLRAVYLANLHLRTANRVLVRIGDFYAVNFAELRKKAARLPWADYLRVGQPIAIRASCHRSKLYHTDAVAQRIAGAIEDALGGAVSVAAADGEESEGIAQLVVVRIAKNHCTISIDSSGELLHRRGYRQAVAKAPLRETFAAAMLLSCGWDRQSPVVDPFCGSGVIPIEASLLANEIPPGSGRKFAFTGWPGFNADLWEQLRSSEAPEPPNLAPVIIGADRDAGAVEMARANARRAGVEHAIEFHCQAISALQPPDRPGWIVTNPPYGVRISAGNDLRNLYAQFGNLLRSRCQGWRVAVLCADPLLVKQMGAKLDSLLEFSTGGIRVRLYTGIVGQTVRKPLS